MHAALQQKHKTKFIEDAQNHLVKSQKYFNIVIWIDKIKLEIFRGNGSAIDLENEEHCICRDKTPCPL